MSRALSQTGQPARGRVCVMQILLQKVCRDGSSDTACLETALECLLKDEKFISFLTSSSVDCTWASILGALIPVYPPQDAAQGRGLWQEAADVIAAAVWVQYIPVQDMLLLLQRHYQAAEISSGIQPCSQGPKACLAQLVVSSYTDGCTPGTGLCTAALSATRAAFEACIEEHHKYIADSQLASVIDDFLTQWQLEAGVRHPVVIHGQDVAATEALLLHRAAELQSQIELSADTQSAAVVSNIITLFEAAQALNKIKLPRSQGGSSKGKKLLMTLEGGVVTLGHSGLVAFGLEVVAGLLHAGLVADSQLDELLKLGSCYLCLLVMIRTVKLGECLASIAGQAVLVQRGLSGRFQTDLLREVYVKLEGDSVTHPHPPRLRALAVGDMLPLVWAYYLQHIAMRSLPIAEAAHQACVKMVRQLGPQSDLDRQIESYQLYSQQLYERQAKQAAEAAEELVKEQDAEHQAAAAAQRAKQQRASKRARQRQRKQAAATPGPSSSGAVSLGRPASTPAVGGQEGDCPAPSAPSAAPLAPPAGLTQEQTLEDAAASVARPRFQPADNDTHGLYATSSTSRAAIPAMPFSLPDDAGQCVVCWEADASVLFRPCGHACTCMSCARPFMHAAPCPVCRANVDSIMILEQQ